MDCVASCYSASAVSSFFFSSRRRHTRCLSDWSSDVCSSDLDDESLGHVRKVEVIVQLRGGPDLAGFHRSEERRVGKVCRSRWSAYHEKKKNRSQEVKLSGPHVIAGWRHKHL